MADYCQTPTAKERVPPMPKIWPSLWQNMVFRLIGYYAILYGIAYVVWRWLPHAALAGRESFDALFSSVGFVATSKKEAAEAVARSPGQKWDRKGVNETRQTAANVTKIVDISRGGR